VPAIRLEGPHADVAGDDVNGEARADAAIFPLVE
jgi:hypothetical protein